MGRFCDPVSNRANGYDDLCDSSDSGSAAAFRSGGIFDSSDMEKMKGDTKMKKKNYPEEIFEAEDLSCVEDEDRIFILDENGKSVEVEVDDDVADD